MVLFTLFFALGIWLLQQQEVLLGSNLWVNYPAKTAWDSAAYSSANRDDLCLVLSALLSEQKI